MNLRRRLAIGLALGALAAVFSGVVAARMLWRAHARGWAGVTIMPPIGSHRVSTGSSKPSVFAYQPRTVVLALPGGPAERAGLVTGDRVLAVDGADYADSKALAAIDDRVNRGTVVTYTVDRGGKRLDIPVRFETPFAVPMTILQTLVSVVVGVFYLAVGVFVFLRKPGDRRVVVFYALMVVSGVSLLGLATAATGSPSWRGIAWDKTTDVIPVIILSFVAIASVPLTLHLALVFPKDRPVMRTTPRVLRWVYGVPIMSFASAAGFIFAFSAVKAMRRGSEAAAFRAIAGSLSAVVLLATIVAVAMIVRKRDGTRSAAFGSRPFTMMAAAFTAVLGLALLLGALGWWKVSFGVACVIAFPPALAVLLMPVISCVALYRSYREANVEERRQVVWPLWGLIIALGGRAVIWVFGAVIGAYVSTTGGDPSRLLNVSQYTDLFSRALLALIPLSFAFAILKYRLMNIDVIIRKTVVYAILSGAIVVLYVVLVGVLGTLVLNLTGAKNQTVVIASTLFVALVFIPLRNKLQTLVDRNLFRHKYDYPAALRAIAQETLSAHDLGTFLGSAAEKVQQALQNRSVVVFVLRNDEHVASAKVGVADSLVGRLRVQHASMRDVLDRPFDPRRRALPEDAARALETIEPALVVPINTPGTPPNGFLTLGSKLSGAELDVEDIDFLRSVADQLDIGIDRIRQQRDDADFAQARAIQQTLLPREMPQLAGIDVSGTWQPARTVGGDYYDLLRLGDHELAVCIGDVAGKGMPAALLMSGLQASVRAMAPEIRSPRELCERVRRVIVSTLSGGRFVTFFYAIVDTAAMKIRWCNAGHNAPILARDDGAVVRLAAGGPALSRLFRDPFEEREIDLVRGDRIVLFTDGVSEARDDSGELLGESRLEELVSTTRNASARELQDAIVETATRFSRGDLEDDVTVVVVKL